ncbi:15839_t:CDS:2, partial [Racocetra fulgida]
ALSDGKLNSKISPHLAKKGGHILRSGESSDSSESEDTSNAEESDSDKSSETSSSEFSSEITNPNEFENLGEQKGKGTQYLVDQIATIDFNFERIKKMSDKEAQTHVDKMKNIDILSQNLKETKSHKTLQEKLFKIIQWYDQQTDETQRTYNKDLENEETRYIENTDDALDIRPEQYINLKEPHRRAVIAKLTAIANTNKNEEERKRANNRWRDNAAMEHSGSNASMTSEAGSSWSENSAAEDKKFQEEQDKIREPTSQPQILPLLLDSAASIAKTTSSSSTNIKSTSSSEQPIQSNARGTPPVKLKDNQYGYNTDEIMNLEQLYWRPQKKK